VIFDSCFYITHFLLPLQQIFGLLTEEIIIVNSLVMYLVYNYTVQLPIERVLFHKKLYRDMRRFNREYKLLFFIIAPKTQTPLS